MKVYERKETTVVKDVWVKTICDVCKKETAERFFAVTTGHHEWGNDSEESVETKDICSVECLKQEFEEYLVAREEYWTQYIEIS